MSFKITIVADCTTDPDGKIGHAYEWAADSGGEKRVTLCSSPTDFKFAGILESFVQVGASQWALSLVGGGIGRGRVGATFTRGTTQMFVKTDGNGKLVPAVNTTTGMVIGYLLPEDNAAIGDGSLCRLFVCPSAHKGA